MRIFFSVFRYTGPSSDEDDCSSESDEDGLQLMFDCRRPRPLRYPSSLTNLVTTINRSTEPTPADVKQWCDQLEQDLTLTPSAAEKVCTETNAQASSPAWYRERVCRLTASNFGLVCKRRPTHRSSLVDQLLYVDPPAAVSALQLGRSQEPTIVKKYVDKMESEDVLVEVSTTGLHVHPSIGFLAASPDRLVIDSSCEPSAGLLEAKYFVSVSGPPEDAIGKRANYCLKKTADGSTHLSKSHNFYFQVQGQMACSSRPWCDFVCMTRTGHLFIERVSFDEKFWIECVSKLTGFFRSHLAPEIVCPRQRDPVSRDESNSDH